MHQANYSRRNTRNTVYLSYSATCLSSICHPVASFFTGKRPVIQASQQINLSLAFLATIIERLDLEGTLKRINFNSPVMNTSRNRVSPACLSNLFQCLNALNAFSPFQAVVLQLPSYFLWILIRSRKAGSHTVRNNHFQHHNLHLLSTAFLMSSSFSSKSRFPF